ncbi:MAG: class I SAM-dependent methyltransferase [Hyphomicrobiales bacterium]|nr:class I SAM-dependent methyltransferase [Hyphomicrobiales bacterium]
MSGIEELRDFYERMPYPPPLTSLHEHRELYKNPERRRATFHLTWPFAPFRENLEILIAGCGTSQAARYAMREPKARVTAIDISETSLRHTRDLQRKYDLRNLELHQLPIERVRDIGRSFDLVVCTGVLHHLPDPDDGLRALRDVMRPKAAMRLMVYAPYGRAGIYMMQEYCRRLGIGASAEELRNLRATIEMLPPTHPVSGVLRNAKDLERSEAMADAFLHPQDRAYTVSEFYAWLDRCGMRFGRWTEQAPYLAQCGVVARSPHVERLAALPSPLQHAAVELFRGTMVSHSCIAYRDDDPDASRIIDFADDKWRDYVPVALPWTVCVRERLPPGSTAVLINRAHRFTDLICAVDCFEDRLLGAIDGRRNLTEILQFAGQGDDANHRARSFFERLWRYDQVVFDASGCAIAGELEAKISFASAARAPSKSSCPDGSTSS